MQTCRLQMSSQIRVILSVHWNALTMHGKPVTVHCWRVVLHLPIFFALFVTLHWYWVSMCIDIGFQCILGCFTMHCWICCNIQFIPPKFTVHCFWIKLCALAMPINALIVVDNALYYINTKRSRAGNLYARKGLSLFFHFIALLILCNALSPILSAL